MLLENFIAPFDLLRLFDRIRFSAEPYHLFVLRVTEDLHSSVRLQLLTEIFAPCRKKIQGIRLIVDSTDISDLWRTAAVYGGKCEHTDQFHFL